MAEQARQQQLNEIEVANRTAEAARLAAVQASEAVEAAEGALALDCI